MPTINGIKMACAPCIRGHRSTKCNHADERLMVPVRKPGRPLSICPHPQDQPCGCGSVTAAIPRKQQCGCGGSDGHDEHSTKPLDNTITVQAKPVHSSAISEIPKSPAGPSPTMKTTSTFRAQKPSRPHTISRHHSYDKENSERLRSEDLNTNGFDAKRMYIKPQHPVSTAEQPNHVEENGSMAWNMVGTKLEPFAGPIANGHSDFNMSIGATGHMLNGGPTTPPMDSESTYGQFSVVSQPQQFQGYTRQLHQQPNGVVIETRIHNPKGITNINGQWVPQYKEDIALAAISRPPSQSQPTNNGERSCCSSKRKREEDPVPPIKEASNGGSCCSSKRTKSISNPTTQSNPLQLTPSQSPRLTPVNNHTNLGSHMTGNFPTSEFIGHPGGFGYVQNAMVYPTVFAYPATYGSYQHPLQPAQWKQGVQYNTYAHMVPVNPSPPTHGPGLEIIGAGMDTLHACGCGDGCECIGCAAHPYNDATQQYVRSAWESGIEQPQLRMSENHQTSSSTARAPNSNGHKVNGLSIQPNGQASSPASNTPSDTTGDDPPLSASDFFFVNYPFAVDGCGGDTQSCPCGDDCACLGCSIHNISDLPPAMPKKEDSTAEVNGEKSGGNCCGGSSESENGDGIDGFDPGFGGEICGGDERTCPCPPDGCECIGCTIHARI